MRKDAKPATRSLVPPALVLCVALLLFFSTYRRVTAPALEALDEASIAVAEELAAERAGIALEGVAPPGEEAVLPGAAVRADELSDLGAPMVAEDHLVIAGLGDVLLLRSLAEESRRVGNFSHLWSPVQRLWNRHAHYAFANMEGTLGAVDRKGALVSTVADFSSVYTTGISTGGFNYHESLARELVDSGVNVLTMANNHVFDRGMQGIATTAQHLIDAGAVQIGATLKPAEPQRPYAEGWYRISKANGWRVAWVGCVRVLSFARLRADARAAQTMLLCPTCRKELSAPREQVEKRILFCDRAPLLVYRLSRRRDVDVVVVGAHWGNQFQDNFAPRTAELAHQILNAGAAVIYGNHPHVMQPAERFRTKDGRDTYVVYSIGSLTSGLGSHKMWKARSSAVVFVEFEKARADRKYKKPTGQVVAVRVVPICEVRIDGALHAMMPTAHASGRCAQEESWAQLLLKDVVGPESLPRVQRGEVEVVADPGWKGTRIVKQGKAAVEADLAAEPDESAVIVSEAEKWKNDAKP